MFQTEFSNVVNQFTNQLVTEFCMEDGAIDWDKLLAFNSARPVLKVKKLK